MDNDDAIYGTPGSETPYSTPISTPRLVPYRINPVKMVRQHVPVKLKSLEDAKLSSSDNDFVNWSPTVNPMKTKRIKCTVQSIGLYCDGVGDQIEYSSKKKQSIPNTLLNSFEEIEYKIDDSALSSRKHSINAANQFMVCNSKGDAETTKIIDINNVEKTHFNKTSSEPQPEQIQECNKSFIPVKEIIKNDVESLLVVEKETAQLHKLIKDKKQSSYINRHVLPNSTERSTSTTVHKINKEVQNVNLGEKQKRYASCKKLSCDQDKYDNLTVNHKCDKKKFYDPKDIRKYMIKKKTERLAKEKEEKNKKANELAAMKRKTEINKLFHIRNRCPSNSNNNTIKNALAQTKDTKKSKNRSQLSRAIPEGEQQNHSTNDKSATVNFDLKKDPFKKPKFTSREIQKTEKMQKDGTDEFLKRNELKNIEETEKYFKKRFDDIITRCVKEANEVVSTELRSSAGISPHTETKKMPIDDLDVIGNNSKHTQTTEKELPTETFDIDVFRTSPYNFLNVLKGKVNLAHNTDLFHNLYENNMLLTPANEQMDQDVTNKRQSMEDILNKRPKLTVSPQTANVFVPKYESHTLSHLKPELTLSDLNLSPYIKDETMKESDKKSGRTFSISEQELRRKSMKIHKHSESKENLNVSFEMSGIRPLASSFQPFISIPLVEKSINCAENGSKSVHDVQCEETNRILFDRTNSYAQYLQIDKNENKESLKIKKKLIPSPNLELLEEQNMPSLLPQSCQLNHENNDYVEQSIKKYDAGFLNSEQIPIINKECLNQMGRDSVSPFEQSDDINQFNSSEILVDLYDQMIKNEDEKLLQVLKKIQLQKEALNKYLKSEVFSLEMQKKQYRECKNEEKIKTIKKKQRGVLLKVTKNILELDKMKKTVTETVNKRKSELLKQKEAMKEKKFLSKQKLSASKQKKKSDPNDRTVLISKQMKTVFGISSSSCTSLILDNNEKNEKINFNNEINTCMQNETSIITHTFHTKPVEVKDTATSPVHFNAGISIRVDLDPEKILQLKNSNTEVKIQSQNNSYGAEVTVTDGIKYHHDIDKDNNKTNEDISEEMKTLEVRENKTIKIKRPLSPIAMPPSKKLLQMRRMSSSSDITFVSFNDTTTTDQSDIELRISALQKQLHQRKLEAERLRKEEKQLRKEKLRSKEQSLMKQLEAYEQYIKKVSKMLTENVDFSEITKPLIRHVSNRKHIMDSYYERNSFEKSISPATSVIAVNEKYGTVKQNGSQMIEDGETNTEDSEKQLKKADSGILIESEVTEPSEYAELKHNMKNEHAQCKKEEDYSIVDDVKSSISSIVHTEETSSLQHQIEHVISPFEVVAKVSNPDNFLRIVNDIHSEVLSLSEQLYSSDFVEDIPEDLVDIKSEVSENAINDNNTSMSIEEILSDHHSDGTEQNKDSSKNYINSSNENEKQEIQEQTYEYQEQRSSESEHETDFENLTIIPEEQKTNEKEDTNIAESVDDVVSDLQLENNRYDIIENLSVDQDINLSTICCNSIENPKSLINDNEENCTMVHDESDDSNAVDVQFIHSNSTATEIQNNETSSNNELKILNVKNISDIDSSDNMEKFEDELLDENEIHSDGRDSFIQEIKSASTLENISDESNTLSKLDNSDGNESKTSHELIKLDYFNESEGSDVADVDKPVQPTEEVQTVINKMKFLSFDDIEELDKSPENFKQNYDNVLDNLKSYFNSKTIQGLFVNDKSISNEMVPEYNELMSVVKSLELLENVSVQTPSKVNQLTVDNNLEETDVSESLEYDYVPVISNNQAVVSFSNTDIKLSQIMCPVTADAHVDLPSENKNYKKSRSESSSREEDRSVEEIVEDFSIPNLFGKTFVVNDESRSEKIQNEEDANLVLSPQQIVPTNKEVKLTNHDLNHISEDETPFLQALRRERESMLAQRKESLDKISFNLFETLIEETFANVIDTMKKKMKHSESENISEDKSELQREENMEILTENPKVDKSFHSGDHVKKYDHEWFEKHIGYNQSRLQEAEELRLQQIKIEQEIEELQAQQHIPPYIYLREIPNKPPPPYTPPIEPTGGKIPSNESELREFIKSTIEYVCDALNKGNNVNDIKQLPEYSETSQINSEVATYKRFLFDLTKEVAENILKESKKTERLPWEELSKQKILKPHLEKNQLTKTIENEIGILFGFKSKINREKLIIQWSRKKKTDFVDDLLIQELQQEENEWMNYEEDELIIKNQITQSLLDELIEDTARSIQDAFQKKE